MNEEVRTNEPTEEQTARARKRGRRVKMLVLCAVAMVTLCPAAFAEGTTGLAAVTAQSSTVVTWVSNVFSMVTGNEYLALLMAFGLTAAAIRLFRRAKRAAR